MSEDPARRRRDTNDPTRTDKPARSSQPVSPNFGTRYRVLGVLGKGGMGEVYRAYDLELKVEVALKVVRSDHEEAIGRFRREVALARKVTSPNVLRIYDLEEHDGVRFLSMEFVDGEDLAAIMRREGRMELAAALRIFRQICEGLAAAHARGVLHRDLKPANVLVDKANSVRVADFGLARSIGDSGMTASGAVLGSPAYMSPEQVTGAPTDERSDIYSLGIMLYQLVTGETPFQAPTPHAVMEMRLHTKPKPMRDLRSDAPAYLEAICAKSLALAPSARFHSVRQLLDVLESGGATPTKTRRYPRWIVPAAVVAVAVGAVAVGIAWPRDQVDHAPPPVAAATAGPAVPTTKGPVTVLLFPVDNRTIEPMFDPTLEAGLELALRRSTRLDPIAGDRVRTLPVELGLDALDDRLGDALAKRDGARVLTVRATVANKASGFTIALKATESVTHHSVLEKTVDTPRLDDVLPAIGTLASALRETVGEKLSDDERAKSVMTSSLEAGHEYALARAMFFAGDPERAASHLERTLAVDPAFALAHFQIADTYRLLMRKVDARNHYDLGLRWIDRIGERDRLKSLGDYYNYVTEEYERAIASYEEILATWPKDLTATTSLAVAHKRRGDMKKALEVGLRAAHEFPHSFAARGNVVGFEVMVGDYARAVADGRAYFAEFQRPSQFGYHFLAAALLLTGRRDDAVEVYTKLDRAYPSLGKTAEADLAFAEGRLRDAASILEHGIADDVAKKRTDQAEIKNAMLAELWLQRGDPARARSYAALVVKHPARLFQAALVDAVAGDDKRVLAIATQLADDTTPSRRAFAKLIEAEVLRARDKSREAIVAIRDALHLDDKPVGHYLLARALLDAKQYAEASSELGVCIVRRGEASFGVDNVPTYRYVPMLTYYLARAQQGLGSSDAATYRAFLAMLHEPDADNPLVADARRQSDEHGH
jgi:tetratricopeptide (TPR) repeat protein/predicted Ser/Thr protein kinase